MTVTAKPPDRGPLFGGKTVVMFVPKEMRESMRRWQERVRAAKEAAEDTDDTVRGDRDPDGEITRRNTPSEGPF